jgi:hypothetical protein
MFAYTSSETLLVTCPELSPKNARTRNVPNYLQITVERKNFPVGTPPETIVVSNLQNAHYI